MPDKLYFVRRGDKKAGPYTGADLKRLAKAGKIRRSDLIRERDANAKEVAAGNVNGLLPSETAPKEVKDGVMPVDSASADHAHLPRIDKRLKLLLIASATFGLLGIIGVAVLLSNKSPRGQIAKFHVGRYVANLTFSPDGRYIAADSRRELGYAGSLSIWTVRPCQSIADFTLGALDESSFAFSPDGRYLASSFGTRVEVRDLSAGSEKVRERKLSNMPTLLVYYPNGDKFLAHARGALGLWDSKTGTPDFLIRTHWDYFWCPTAHSLDGHTVAYPKQWDSSKLRTNDRYGLAIYDLKRRREVTVLSSVCDRNEDILLRKDSYAVSGDGSTVATVNSQFSKSKSKYVSDEIAIWSGKTGKNLRSWSIEGESPPTSVALSPDGQLLAVAYSKQVLTEYGDDVKYQQFVTPVRVYEVSTGVILGSLERRSPSALAFSPDGLVLAIGNSEGQVGLVEIGRAF